MVRLSRPRLCPRRCLHGPNRGPHRGPRRRRQGMRVSLRGYLRDRRQVLVFPRRRVIRGVHRCRLLGFLPGRRQGRRCRMLMRSLHRQKFLMPVSLGSGPRVLLRCRVAIHSLHHRNGIPVSLGLGRRMEVRHRCHPNHQCKMAIHGLHYQSGNPLSLCHHHHHRFQWHLDQICPNFRQPNLACMHRKLLRLPA